MEQHAGAVPWCVALSADGSRIAAGTALGRVRIWHTDGRGILFELGTGGEGVSSVAFSPTGELIAAGTEEGRVFLWDAASASELSCLDGHGSIVSAVAFSSDCRRLVAVGGTVGNRLYGITKVWALRSRRCLVTFPGYTDASAIALGTTAMPLVVGRTETIVQSLRGPASVAFWPDQLHDTTFDARAGVWVGAVGNHLCILRLEPGERQHGPP